MKRILFGLIGCALLASPAFGVYTFSYGELLSFTDLGNYSNDSDGYTWDVLNPYTNPPYAWPNAGEVGWIANSVGRNEQLTPEWEWLAIGTTGLDFGTETSLEITLRNDNDDTWYYKLFADTDADPTIVEESGSWTAIGNGEIKTLSLSLPSTGDWSSATAGFYIGHNSHRNTIKTAVPIPSPGALLLAGVGVGLVGWMRRRTAL